MTKQTEALKLALEALENLLYWDNGKPEYDEAREAITAIKQALAQPEQEPVAVYGYCPECGAEGVARERRPDGNDCCANGHTYPSRTANKTPQRKPLTDQQIVDLCDGTLTTWEQVRIARAIEAAHGIKE